MRKYRPYATSSVRIEYGIELHAGLSQFDETQAAANECAAVNNALAAQHQLRLQLHGPVLETRALLRFAEYNVDRVIRSVHRAAEIEDGGRRGRISTCLFPNGLTPVIKPSGRGQLKPTNDLIDRLRLAKLTGIDAFRSVWLAKLETARTKFETVLATHDAAQAAHDEAFRAEIALRAAHWEMLDRVMGVVRMAFPLDRDLQDLIFPPVEETSKRENAPGEEIEKAPVSVGHA